MEEVLLCCTSVLLLVGVLLGMFLFSLYIKWLNKTSQDAPQASDDETKLASNEQQIQIKDSNQKTGPNVLETLLTTLGVWLGLPSICSTSQRLLEDLTSFGSFNPNIASAIKLIADGLLLGLLITGLTVFVLIVIAGWGTGVIWKTLIHPNWQSLSNKFRNRKTKQAKTTSLISKDINATKEPVRDSNAESEPPSSGDASIGE